MLTASALIILSLGSCKKDNLASNDHPGGTSQPFTLTLIANQWIKNVNGIYVDNFKGVIPASNAGNSNVKVYLVENGEETQMNHSFISFMSNELWATNTQTDVTINYRCSAPTLPFNSLQVKIVVE